MIGHLVTYATTPLPIPLLIDPEGPAAPLLIESTHQGWEHLVRLVADARSGVNLFDAEGECLLGVFDGSVLLGLGGVNRDPHSGLQRTGRIRRLYIAEQARRTGAGRLLVDALIQASQGAFDTYVLRTHDINAAAFYEALGFARVHDVEGATHRLLNC